jgi:hypothetical protein
MIMTLQEYHEKYKNVEKTHPAPEGMEWPLTNRHYRKIIEAWQEELSKEDRERIQNQERSFARKMAF